MAKLNMKRPAGLEALREKGRRRRASTDGCAAVPELSHPARNDLTPALHLVTRRIEALKFAPRRLQRRDEADTRRTAASIRQLGWCLPILINGDNEIIDGHGRTEAAKLAGLDEVSCVVVSHLTEEEQRLLALTISRQEKQAVWDLDALRLEIEDLIQVGQPVEIAFSLPEIDQIRLTDEPDAVERGPLDPEDDARAITRLNDVWRLRDHLVRCGDAWDPAALKALAGDRAVRMVLTDVPYNVPVRGHITKGRHREFAMAAGEMSADEFEQFNIDWMSACLPLVMDGGLISSFIDWRGLVSISAAAFSLGLKQLNLAVWTKNNAGQGSLYRSQHELLPIFKIGTATHLNNVALGRHGRWRSNVWRYAGASSLGSDARKGLKIHPTVKPTAMLEDALLDLTNRGEVVIDPFLGSGSTLMAAETTGRVCIGVELDPLYVDVVLRRWIEVFASQPVLESTGETFADVERQRLDEEAAPSRSSPSTPKPRVRTRAGSERGAR